VTPRCQIERSPDTRSAGVFRDGFLAITTNPAKNSASLQSFEENYWDSVGEEGPFRVIETLSAEYGGGSKMRAAAAVMTVGGRHWACVFLGTFHGTTGPREKEAVLGLPRLCAPRFLKRCRIW
jgi:hypothetical protein